MSPADPGCAALHVLQYRGDLVPVGVSSYGTATQLESDVVPLAALFTARFAQVGRTIPIHMHLDFGTSVTAATLKVRLDFETLVEIGGH